MRADDKLTVQEQAQVVWAAYLQLPKDRQLEIDRSSMYEVCIARAISLESVDPNRASGAYLDRLQSKIRAVAG